MTSLFDVRQIMEIIPHRYPFLLVDKILELVPGEHVKGLKNVTINEPFFQGHFPGEPIMPGVLVLEAMAQTAAVLAFETHPERERGEPIYFLGIDKVRFRKPVLPGDQIIFELRDYKQKRNIMKMKGTATIDGQLAVEAELMAGWGK
ncbi:3-hydroxyacyl-[acyl-carrier-protein] dehydratase [Desulfatibacillum alkenivorans DSM 16219]|jgi:beta-hydroxyacyl-ACP dehydratase FabZ|uniref:3-hydroxyacyl-[acyl-carrier-protein] dehydratase FabZ n=1 Tax=Desulfatibacillum alkenivorans DSM 16219 TaxID=1121393 RepID=A0A1M6CLG6_9BACT|nr:3-hydroxyacyl-ACP dehydratase FabZ [Desulfatibacillum alkenivorans]SHI61830.1 3-hydroxyacyl-[acyl-carrier-protein] dehydratase [Desulfatibacillum alkenivorans DSM 16219]